MHVSDCVNVCVCLSAWGEGRRTGMSVGMESWTKEQAHVLERLAMVAWNRTQRVLDGAVSDIYRWSTTYTQRKKASVQNGWRWGVG